MSPHQYILQRPALAYQMAFDRCAVESARRDGPLLLLASSLFYARELLRRLGDQVTLSLTADMSTAAQENLKTHLGPEISSDQLHYLAEFLAPSTPLVYPTIIWAEPQETSWRTIIPGLQRFQGTGTTLLIIGRNPRFSPFLPQQPPQAAQAVGLKKIEDQLQGKKWRVANRYGFSGPLSLFLGTINRFFINLNRHDLLDRNNAAIRKYALVQGRSAYYSPLWGLTLLS